MTRCLDCVVVGAGPAGLQAGYFLAQAGREYAILEAGQAPGTFFGTFPRSRRLISFNKTSSLTDDAETALRWDWNSLLTAEHAFRYSRFDRSLFPHADRLRRYLAAYAREFGLAVEYSSRVTRISRPDGRFLIDVSGHDPIEARYLVIATGVSEPYLPPIPGIELAEGYETVPMSAAAFQGQRVLILGKGNSAFEVAEVAQETAALVHVASPHSLRFAWQTRHAGDLRANKMRLLDMYQLKMLNAVLDGEVKQIDKTTDGLEVRIAYAHADGQHEVLRYDRVIRCTGFRFDASIFAPECSPRLAIRDRFPAMTSLWESENVPGIFFAGTLMQTIDHKHAASTFIHGFRYNIRTLAAYLGRRYHGETAAPDAVPADPGALADWILGRVSTTSALWSQFEFLCDVIVATPPGAGVYRELPVAFAQGEFASHEGLYLTVCFEWGTYGGDVFAIRRQTTSEAASSNVFLHPVVRSYKAGEMLAEHHVLEDLMGTFQAEAENGSVIERSGRGIADYHDDQHRAPLIKFLAAELNAVGS